MFEPTDLDPREQEIYDSADQFWATRFNGGGSYDRLGPFATQEELLLQIERFFSQEQNVNPRLRTRPFAVYAHATTVAQGQVILGNVWRDGGRRLTQREVSLRRQEERARSRSKPRGGGDPTRSS